MMQAPLLGGGRKELFHLVVASPFRTKAGFIGGHVIFCRLDVGFWQCSVLDYVIHNLKCTYSEPTVNISFAARYEGCCVVHDVVAAIC